MTGNDGALVFCLNVLPWLGLSFTKVKQSPEGSLIASDSKLHLFTNMLTIGVFILTFLRIKVNTYDYVTEIYKTTTIVYLLYTKLMILAIIVFSFCGNAYNRKSVDIVNLFSRIRTELERHFGYVSPREDKNGWKILVLFSIYVLVTTILSVWADFHVTFHFNWFFRIIHYFCFYYVTVFTAHFVVTMNFLRRNFASFNSAFSKITECASISGGSLPVRRKLGIWMAAFMDLREVETLTNEVFGKQIFLTFLLAFSSVIVNAYYFITLNLHGTSYAWLNLTMSVGFFQSVTVALISTIAAETATKEANKVNKVVFTFPVHLNNWQMYDQIKYFSLYTHYNPMEFKAWIFYAINYDSLLKVILTSSAITAVILQCDFLKEQGFLKTE